MRAVRMVLSLVVVALIQGAPPAIAQSSAPDVVLLGGKIITVDQKNTVTEAIAIRNSRIVAMGSSANVRKLSGPRTQVIDLGGRTVVPGLIDSHIHAIRDALYYKAKVDWSGVRNIEEALESIRAAARQASPGTWLVVIGAWHQNQLAERRPPTPQELDQAAPNNPVYVQHQFDFAVLNRLGVQTLGITQATVPTPVKVEVDNSGTPTGMIEAKGSGGAMAQLAARVIHPTMDQGVQSIPTYFHALNRQGITGIIDQGDLNIEEYQALFNVWREGGLTLRVRYNLFSRRTGAELAHIQTLTQLIPPSWGDEWLRMLGLGEISVWGMYDGSLNAADLTPSREVKKSAMEFAAWTASRGYSLHVHASHEPMVRAYLDIFEDVNKTTPISALRWKITHGENMSDESLRRMKALGMGFNVQDRMYFGGDDYLKGRGEAVARRSPPIMTATHLGLIVAAGTDATVVSPYSPFVSLRWLVTGRTLTGAATRSGEEIPSRLEALRMYTLNGAWMSFEERDRGSLEMNKLADLVVLDRDYMTISSDDIANIRPLMTMVGGEVVYAEAPFVRAKTRRTE